MESSACNFSITHLHSFLVLSITLIIIRFNLEIRKALQKKEKETAKMYTSTAQSFPKTKYIKQSQTAGDLYTRLSNGVFE